MRVVAWVALAAIFLTAWAGRVSATVIDFDLRYRGMLTGTGQFSFDQSLLGQAISASELSTFSIEFDRGPFNGPNETFNALATPPAEYEHFGINPSLVMAPYFDFNSASDTFIDQNGVAISGELLDLSHPIDSDGFSTLEFVLKDNRQAYSSIYVGHLMPHGSSGEYGSFDQIVITSVAVTEPSSAAVFCMGLLMLIATGLWRTTLHRRAAIIGLLSP